MSLHYKFGPTSLRSPSGKDMKVVPLRSSSSTREKVSTDTNQKSVKTVVTVTTSRQAGQRIINKNTLTTTTNTNTHGIVVTGDPDREGPRGTGAQRKHSKEGKGKQNNFERNQTDVYYNQYKNLNVPQRNNLSHTTAQRQYQELEEIKQKQLVGTLKGKFDHVDVQTTLKSPPKMNRIGHEGRTDTNTYGEKYNGKRYENYDKNKTHGIQSSEHFIIRNDTYAQRSEDNETNTNKNDYNILYYNDDQYNIHNHAFQQQSILPTIPNVTRTPNECKKSSYDDVSQPHLKTFTFTIPRSSLFQVSSKKLKSILDSPGDLSAVLSPSIISEASGSGIVTSASGNGIIGFQSNNVDNTQENSKLWKIRESQTIQSDPSSVANETMMHCPTSGGLDYGSIWGSAIREVEIKPRRAFTCYKDYLKL